MPAALAVARASGSETREGEEETVSCFFVVSILSRSSALLLWRDRGPHVRCSVLVTKCRRFFHQRKEKPYLELSSERYFMSDFDQHKNTFPTGFHLKRCVFSVQIYAYICIYMHTYAYVLCITYIIHIYRYISIIYTYVCVCVRVCVCVCVGVCVCVCVCVI
jgi:hypothetical protein